MFGFSLALLAIGIGLTLTGLLIHLREQADRS